MPVRQRNDQDHELVVHTIPPQTVQPGDTVDWDDPVVGLTVLDDDPEPAAEPAEPAGTGRARRAPTTRTTDRTDQAQEG
jgi:hypothetical protein